MSLDHIILSDTVLEKLYRDSLVTGNSATAAKTAKTKVTKTTEKETPAAAGPIKFLGNNKKKIQLYFLELIGCNVNLGNIAPSEMIALEAMRIGLRGDTFMFYLDKK